MTPPPRPPPAPQRPLRRPCIAPLYRALAPTLTTITVHTLASAAVGCSARTYPANANVNAREYMASKLPMPFTSILPWSSPCE